MGYDTEKEYSQTLAICTFRVLLKSLENKGHRVGHQLVSACYAIEILLTILLYFNLLTRAIRS